MADHRQRTGERKQEVTTTDRASRRAAERRKRRTDRIAPDRSRIAGLPPRAWSVLAFWVMVAIFARYYYWTVRPDSSRPIQEIGAYLLLTDAFHHGQASLRVPPAPQLLALPDPYDPVQNERYRLHDASLYKSRFYLYFGPAPVLALYLPYLVVFGEFLPDRLGTWVFAVAAYAVACALLKLLIRRWWPHSPPWLFYFLAVCLGFSNTYPFLLRRPAMYETAIVAGQFFMLLGIYAIALSAFGKRHSMWLAALAGVALAGALASRPQIVLSAIALVWFLALNQETALRERLRRFGAAALPLAAGTALVLVYNYIRFDSIFEFGNHYQLAAVNVRKTQLFSVARMIQNIWFAVIEPPRLRSRFPFVVLAPNPPFHLPAKFSGLELVAGILWLAPIVVLLVAAPLVWSKADLVRRREWGCCLGTFVLLGAAWIAIDGMVGSTMRYQADFATVLFLAGALTAAGFYEFAADRTRRWLLRAIVTAGLLGVIINGATGITGYYDNLLAEAPGQYQTLANWFSPVAKVLEWCGVPRERSPAPQVNVD